MQYDFRYMPLGFFLRLVILEAAICKLRYNFVTGTYSKLSKILNTLIMDVIILMEISKI